MCRYANVQMKDTKKKVQMLKLVSQFAHLHICISAHQNYFGISNTFVSTSTLYFTPVTVMVISKPWFLTVV